MTIWTEEQLRRLFPNEPFQGGGFSVPPTKYYSRTEEEAVKGENPLINLNHYSSTNKYAEAIINQRSNISHLFTEVFSRYHPLPEKLVDVDMSHYLVRPFDLSQPMFVEFRSSFHPPRRDEVAYDNSLLIARNDFRDVIAALAVRREREISVTMMKKKWYQERVWYRAIRKMNRIGTENEYYTPKPFLHYQFLKEQMYLLELYKNLVSLPPGDISTEPKQLSGCDQALLDMYTAPPNQRLLQAQNLQECIAKERCKEAYNKYKNAAGDEKDFALDSLFDCVSSFPEYTHVRQVQRKYGN